MKIEDIINIKKDSVEERIKKAIVDTKDELSGLTTETTCIIYSAALSRNLYNEHLPNEELSTTDFNYPYEHHFNVVPKNKEEFYLIDLTYKQFQSTKFEKLLQKGYILIKNDTFEEYLDVVGNAQILGRKKK